MESNIPSLPTESDFIPYDNDLDAQEAWKNFGGLTLDEAKNKFQERPKIYSENFMFMGGKAFAFYFPVIEGYLLDVPVEYEYENDDHESFFLAHCIKYQFDAKTAHHVLHLAPRVIVLSQYVRQNIGRFGFDEYEERRISDAWVELVTHIESKTAN